MHCVPLHDHLFYLLPLHFKGHLHVYTPLPYRQGIKATDYFQAILKSLCSLPDHTSSAFSSPSRSPSFSSEKLTRSQWNRPKPTSIFVLLCLHTPACHDKCRIPGPIAHTDLLCSEEVCSSPSLSWLDASFPQWKRGVNTAERPELEGHMPTLAPGHRKPSHHYWACQPPPPPTHKWLQGPPPISQLAGCAAGTPTSLLPHTHSPSFHQSMQGALVRTLPCHSFPSPPIWGTTSGITALGWSLPFSGY